MKDRQKSYFDRNNVGENKAEVLFEKYCKDNSIAFYRMGFDEKKGYIPEFYNIPKELRSLPDYLTFGKNGLSFVHIKGTDKFKLDDLISYSAFEDRYCDKIPLYVAFCFDNENYFLTLDEVKKKLTSLRVQQFTNDKKQYFNLKLGSVE